MDLSAFLTVQTTQGGKGKAVVSGQALGNGALGGAGLLGAMPGGNFMDLIFARMNGEDAGQQNGASGMFCHQQACETPATGETISSTLNFTPQQDPLSAEQVIQQALDNGLIDQETADTLFSFAEAPSEDVPVDLAEQISALREALANDETLGDDEILTLAELLNAIAPSGNAAQATDKAGDTETGVKAVDSEVKPVIVKHDSGLPQTEAEAVAEETVKLVPPQRRNKLIKFLEHLVQALPAESKPTILAIPPGQLRKAIANLQVDVTEGGDDSAPALIATGLTPEKLTELIENLADGTEQGEALVIGFVKILPPEAKKEAIFLPRAILLPPTQPQAPVNGGEIAAPIVDGETQITTDNNKPAQQQSTGNKPETTGNFTAETKDFVSTLTQLITSGENGVFTDGIEGDGLKKSGFNRVLEVLEQAQKQGATNNAAPGLGKAADAIQQKLSAGLSTVEGNDLQTRLGSLVSSAAWESIFPDGWDFSTGQGNSLNFTGPGQLASLVTNVQHAGHPHPATQTVASVIAKATTNGESKNITIRLDPPDLGRVEIRMEFNKESRGMKTHLVIEKPETYMMLQRDAHVLERTLQDIGMDGGDASLSFELADDGGAFGQDGNNNRGSNDSGGGMSGGEGEEEIIIETKMDWWVDPDTGVMRYDILA